MVTFVPRIYNDRVPQLVRERVVISSKPYQASTVVTVLLCRMMACKGLRDSTGLFGCHC